MTVAFREPLRLLHVVHSLDVGGLENGVVNLINRLDPERFTQVICCLTRSGKLAGRIEHKGIEIFELGHAANNRRFPMLSLTRLFRRLSPHVVHTRGWGTVDAVFAARLARVPAVIHGEHGRDWTDTQGVTSRRNHIRRLVGLMVDRYVVVCDFFRRWLSETCKIRDSKILHIPNGVDTKKFFPLEITDNSQGLTLSPDVKALRGRLGLPQEGALIGSVGRLDPVKDFPTLLNGFAQVQSRHTNARLVVVGDGPTCGELTRLASDLGVAPYVCWLGEREDIPSLLRCFDLFVQSSIFEGMSNTILEAMASGLPVITTDVGGNAELVKNGITGVLVPPRQPAALASGILRYLQTPHLRANHAKAARTRTLEQFDIERMVAAYGELYVSVARANGRFDQAHVYPPETAAP